MLVRTAKSAGRVSRTAASQALTSEVSTISIKNMELMIRNRSKDQYVKEWNGIHFLVNNREVDPETEINTNFPSWDTWKKYFSKEKKEWDLFLDIGGNIGFYTILASSDDVRGSISFLSSMGYKYLDQNEMSRDAFFTNNKTVRGNIFPIEKHTKALRRNLKIKRVGDHVRRVIPEKMFHLLVRTVRKFSLLKNV